MSWIWEGVRVRVRVDADVDRSAEDILIAGDLGRGREGCVDDGRDCEETLDP
jgi:hypothetical protein